MVSNHAHNAVQGALLDARDQIAREEAARGGLARGDSRGHATGGRGAKEKVHRRDLTWI